MAVETAAPEVEELLDTEKGHRRPGFRPYVRSWWTLPCGETMRRINIFQFYRFGRAMEQLTLVEREKSLLDQWPLFLNADSALDDILRQEHISLKEIAPAVLELKSEMSAITDRLFETTFDKDEKIKQAPLARLQDSFRRFETVLEAELAGRVNVYSVSRKRLYATTDLIEHSEFSLPEVLLQYLPSEALDDLRQGGRCLAFEIPTGGGFHLLRATESVIKKYYEALAGQPWPHRKRDWGEYIAQLKNLGAPVKVTDVLEQVRVNYRNPLMHPDDSLDMDEAFSLFAVLQGLLSMVLQEISILNP